MIDMNYYRKIQNMGDSYDIRDAQRYEIKNDILRDFSKPLDDINVSINGNIQEITILDTVNTYIKKIKSKPDESFNAGDFVVWDEVYWLITEVDFNNSLLVSGKMQQCNWELKWQNELGEIISRWAIVQSASKYNDGTNENNTIAIGSDQLSVIVPVDSETIKLKKSMGKKFFIDHNTTDPTTYELTGTGNVEGTYGEHGVTSWIVKECPYTATADDLEWGVCEYWAAESGGEEETGWHMEMTCPSTRLYIGASERTITALLVDGDGEEVFVDGDYNEINDIEYVWTVTTDVPNSISYSTSNGGKTFKIRALEDYDSVDEEVTVRCSSRYTGQASEIVFTIQEVG